MASEISFLAGGGATIGRGARLAGDFSEGVEGKSAGDDPAATAGETGFICGLGAFSKSLNAPARPAKFCAGTCATLAVFNHSVTIESPSAKTGSLGD